MAGIETVLNERKDKNQEEKVNAERERKKVTTELRRKNANRKSKNVSESVKTGVG